MIFNRKKIEEQQNEMGYRDLRIRDLDKQLQSYRIVKGNLEKDLSDQKERYRQLKFQYDSKAEHYTLLKEENQLLRDRLALGIPLAPAKARKKYIKTGKYKGVFATRQERIKLNDNV